MIVSLVQILTGYGQNVVNDIRSNLSSTGTNATGKTSSSIRYTITEEGSKTILEVSGRPFVFTVETGRGPRRSSQSHGVVNHIREWMDAKGVGSGLSEAKKDSLARFLTWRINKEGTRLYKKGGRVDIIGEVVNTSLYDKITKELLETFTKAYMDEVGKLIIKAA